MPSTSFCPQSDSAALKLCKGKAIEKMKATSVAQVLIMADWDRLSPERCLNLADGLKLSPQNVHSQADKRIRSGIRRQNLMQADRVMPASNRDGARQTDESPDILQSFVCRRKVAMANTAYKPATRKPAPAHIAILYFMRPLPTFLIQ